MSRGRPHSLTDTPLKIQDTHKKLLVVKMA